MYSSSLLCAAGQGCLTCTEERLQCSLFPLVCSFLIKQQQSNVLMPLYFIKYEIICANANEIYCTFSHMFKAQVCSVKTMQMFDVVNYEIKVQSAQSVLFYSKLWSYYRVLTQG